MNLDIFNVLSIVSIKSVSPYILFGIYYGLLATLPIGPSQILCIRSFILGGNISGLVSLGGSMLGQLAIISSIYCSPIYMFLSKPHMLTVAAIPYTIMFCLTIKELPDYRTLRPVNSLYDLRMVSLFINSFIFQLINPILLPNPVLARLIYLFLFRYSNNLVFVISSFLGWLTGHLLLSYMSKLFIIYVERDSTLPFLLVKQAVYVTFSIVFLIIVLTYLGRAPAPLSTRQFLDESHEKDMYFWELPYYPDFLWWIFKPWPTPFFDPSKSNRGNRFIPNCRFKERSSICKAKTSNYFFDKCLTDGRPRLSFTALPSLSIFDKQLEESLSLARLYVFPNNYVSNQDWILDKLMKNKVFQRELTGRIGLLDSRSIFSEAMERKTRLKSESSESNESSERVPYVYDPFINNFDIRIPITKTEMKSVRRRGTNKKNAIIDWVYAKNRKCKPAINIPLPWEILPGRTQRIFEFLFRDGVFEYSDKIEEILEKISSLSKADVTWEKLMDLKPRHRALFLIYLKGEEINGCFSQIFLSSLFSISRRNKIFYPRREAHKLHRIENLTVELARNYKLYFDIDLDSTDIDSDTRSRKLRNLGISFPKGKPQLAKLVKRYAKISDFRRKFIKGSMRSRRRKIVIWSVFQDKAHSPFFIRLTEVPLSLQPPVVQIPNLDFQINNPKSTTYLQTEQQLKIFSAAKRYLSESKLTRSAMAARLDVGPIHNGRGYMLVFQSKFRKFIKLPILIVLKSIGRMVLWQKSEWDKDWIEWNKEVHINCTFDGEEFSQDQLPGRWLKEGLQIKIVYPFRLKPWYTDEAKKRVSKHKKDLRIESNLSRSSGKRRVPKRKTPNFTYLTVLGYQTDVPFGTVQKEVSFWKPVIKRLVRVCKKNLLLRIKQTYQIVNSTFDISRMLEPSLSLLKKFHSVFYNKKISIDPVYHQNSRIEDFSVNSIKESIKHKVETEEKSKTSINFSGEPRSIINDNNTLVVKEPISIKNKIVANYRVHAPINMSDVKADIYGSNSEASRVNQLILNSKMEDIACFRLSLFEEKYIDLQEMRLKSRVFLRETIEKSALTVSALCRKINRGFINCSNEITVFCSQLTDIVRNIKNIIEEADLFVLGSKNKHKFPQIKMTQLLSQASVRDAIWNTGAGESINLNLFELNSNGTKNSGEAIKHTGGWNKSLINYKPKQLRGSTEHLYDYSCNYYSEAVTTSSLSELDVSKESCMRKMNSSSLQQFIDPNIRKCLENWGLSKKLLDLDINSWNKWIDRLCRCNILLTTWYNVAPHKWKLSVNRLDLLENIEQNNLDGQKLSNIFQQRRYRNSYCIYITKYSIEERVKNISRRRRCRHLLQNLFDITRDGDIQTLSIWQNVLTQKAHFKSRICKVSKIMARGVKRSITSQNFGAESFNSKFDLMLWLKSNTLRIKQVSGKETAMGDDPFLRDNNKSEVIVYISHRFQDIWDELSEASLDNRELSKSDLVRWKWKSELEIEKLRNLVTLTNMLGSDDQDLAALCLNSGIDSSLLDFYINKIIQVGFFDDLTNYSAHRLAILFDDQNLIYKMVNPLLKLRVGSDERVKKHSYRNIYRDIYMSKSPLIATQRSKNYSDLYNIEDLLLPRRRREVRFVRSLFVLKSPELKAQNFDLIADLEKPRKKMKRKSSELNEARRIKRFLWPSHRLEELACVGRFSLNILNESRFAMLKIRMYPNTQN
uniref:Protein TIC 214 n=1 Tax=Lindsaea linearis TaxID=641179 RepID=A0A5B9RBS9_9MONI|nr:conserved hypothetical chloroplast protein ycf1 [Lindsaea linearis]QEG57406.1 conserved hypothetical chloroplast protein ycf1 [Lindsaea linearis]